MSQSQEVALREATQSAIAQLQDPEFARQVELATSEDVSHRQILRVAATAVLKNKELARLDLRPSLLQSTLECAAIDLLPDGNEAVFKIYKTKKGDVVRLEVMIGGCRKIGARHGWSLFTAVVYENDRFDPDLDAHRANHKPTPLGQDRGKPIGAYAIAEHRDGRRMGPEIYTLDDIEKVRAKSPAKAAGPWVDWWERMAEKTVGKRLFKLLPLDRGDRRIAGVLKAIEQEDPVNALYGPEGEFVENDRDDWHQPAAPELDEPSDEELAMLGGGEPVEADSGAVRFDRGKFEGQTLTEVYLQGQVGIGYLKWALREWRDEEFKQVLQAFAAQHPDLGGEQ